MTQEELSLLFPAVYHMENLILLIPPTELYKLEGSIIEGSRIFVLVCAGSIDIELNDFHCEIKAHSFFDIIETTTIKINKTSTDLQAWCLFVTFEFASESLKNLRPGPLTPFLERHIPIWNLCQKESCLLEQQLSLLQNALSNTKHYYRKELTELYFKSFSLELGNIMFTHKKDTDDLPSYISKRDFITLNFIKLVSRHFAKEHRIGFYAKSLCLSSKHLTRIVKEMTGKTPHAVICDEITHQAMTMLEDDNIPISHIAEELNFSDQAAFCKFFKKQKKISPMAYRRKIK